MYARHMALAKAFPDNFTYEPHEPTAVSMTLCKTGGNASLDTVYVKVLCS